MEKKEYIKLRTEKKVGDAHTLKEANKIFGIKLNKKNIKKSQKK